MAGPGYKAVNLPDDLVERMDRFIQDNDWGYRSRAELAASAIRVFLGESTWQRRELFHELAQQKKKARHNQEP